MRVFTFAASMLPTILVAVGAHAVPIVHGTFGPEDTVIYVDVQEDSVSPPPGGLLGAPALTGNMLRFAPTGFEAEGQNGSTQSTGGVATFDLVIVSKHLLKELEIQIVGDYSLSGTGDAEVMAALSAVLIVQEDTTGTLPVPVSMSNSTALFRNIAIDGEVGNATYAAPIDFQIDDILGRTGNRSTSGATRASLELTIDLFAAGGNATRGAIDVSQLDVLPTVVLDPDVRVSEPSVLANIGLGLVGLIYTARRKRKAA